MHAELGELVAGTRPGRGRPDELTLYKSVGVAVEDDAAAALALRGAEARELGTSSSSDRARARRSSHHAPPRS